jgi:hypothetical protein
MKSKIEKKNTTGKAKGCWDDEEDSNTTSGNEVKKNPWEKPSIVQQNNDSSKINTGKIPTNQVNLSNTQTKKENIEEKKNVFSQM